MKLWFHSCLLVCLITTSVGWINHLILDSGEKYHTWWSLIGENITFRIEVATTGWIAFGISLTGEVAGSDLITAWMKDNKLIFHDRYSDDNGNLLIDDHQDWELLRYSANGTHTVIKFHRKLITCDKYDISITEDTIRLIYAYDDKNPQFHEEIVYQQASNHGVKSIYLLQPQLKVSNEDSLYWDVKSPNVKIKKDAKPKYICSIHKAPNLGRKHHIIAFDAVLQPDHEKYVHHIILSACLGATDEEMEPYINSSIPCIEDGISWNFAKCQIAVATWTIHKRETVYPKHIGLPFGDSRSSYFVLDVHYHNISSDTEYLDNSGLRIKYTSNLRQYDAALLIVGSAMTPCVIIPPKQKKFKVVGHASSTCLSPALPPTGITIYAVKLHSHLTGRKLTLRHFRDGRELPPLAKDDNFDFYYQEDRIVKEEVKVLPGDHLTMECIYDSSARNVTTLGGFSSTDEMCLAYILYYPIIARSAILSSPSCGLIAGLTGALVNSELPQWIISPESGQNESFANYISTYQWNSLQIPSVQEATLYSPHSSVCTSDGGTVIRPPRTSSYPDIKQAYHPRQECLHI